MKLTILGSGTDASQIPGVPNRYPPGFLLDLGEEQVLFDVSEGVRFRIEKAGYEYFNIKHLAITHSHPDHYALPQFYQSFWNNLQWSKKAGEQRALNIYAPKQIIGQWWELWNKYQPSLPKGLPMPKLRFVEMPKKNNLKIGKAVLSAEEVFHGFGKVDALSFRLKMEGKIFVYSGDTGLCDGIYEITQGADLFVCECSADIDDFENAKKYGHLNPRQAGEIAQTSDVKKLVLFHYPGLDSDEILIEEVRKSGFGGEVVVGKDFQVFEV